MKSTFARILFLAVSVAAIQSFAQTSELGPITEAEVKAAIVGKVEAIARAKSGLGKRYCAAADGSAGMRFYVDSQVRIGFLFPFTGGVERGMEAPAVVQSLKQIAMPREVSQTYQMYGITGRIADQVAVVQLLSYEAGQPLITFASLGFYVDENGNLDRENSILLLTDQRNGTFFVGSTKNCR